MARPRLETPSFRLGLRNGRYYVQWWQDGAHRVATGTADRREAERFLAQFVASTLEPPPPALPTVGAILDGYLADRTPRVASPATLRYACAALRRHLGELTPEHLTTARSRLYAKQRRAEGHEVGPATARRRKPTANGTVARELVTLRAAMRWAVSQRWITAFRHIEVPPQAKPRDRWLSRDEAAQLLLEAQAPHVRLFIALALYTAARSGALLELTWQQVDLARGVIHLGPGNGNKRRSSVPIPDALRPYLLEARSGATCDAVVEFAGRQVASVQTGFRAACRRARLAGVTPHILRHTAATWMAIGGVPIRDIARFLGDSEAVTERVYAKHSPDYLRGAAKVLGGMG